MIEHKLKIPKHIKRVIKEEKQLRKKIYKLAQFLNTQEGSPEILLTEDQHNKLTEQYDVMENYQSILKDRIRVDTLMSIRNKESFPKNVLVTQIDVDNKLVRHFLNNEEDKIAIKSMLIQEADNA